MARPGLGGRGAGNRLWSGGASSEQRNGEPGDQAEDKAVGRAPPGRAPPAANKLFSNEVQMSNK